jgi:hypothetical protein
MTPLRPQSGVADLALGSMNTRLSTIVCIGLVIRCICSAHVASTPPQNWKRATPIYLGSGFSHLNLSHNSPEVVRQEILDTNTVRLIATFSGLTEADLATVQIVQEPGYSWVEVNQLGNSEKAFNVLSDELRNYVRAREEGHTRAFLLAALTNRVAASAISDPDLRAIAANRTLLPISWLKKLDSGTTTNKAGVVASRTISTTVVNGKSVTKETAYIPRVDEVCRWVSYVLVDGEVAWRYSVKFKADGALDYVHDSRCDAKEYDTKYQKAIKEVEDEADAEMKRDGSFGRFGSVHTFWHLKKEKLRTRGIEWRSPAELNPNTNYD